MKRIFSIILDVLIAGIIIFWVYLLYQDYNQLPVNTVQSQYLFFNIKILLFSLFLIVSLSLSVLINQIQLKHDPENSTQKNFFVPTDKEGENLPELEIIRKILDQKLQIIDKLWEQSIHTENKNDGDEENLLSILETQKKLIEPKNVKNLIIQTVETVAEFTRSSRVSIFLYNKNKNNLEMIYGKGFTDSQASVEIKDTIDGYVYENGKRIFVTNIETHPELGRDNKPQYETKSFIVFPLKLSNQQTIGVLNITEKTDNSGMYSMLDLEKINLLLNQSLLKLEILIQTEQKTLDNPVGLIDN